MRLLISVALCICTKYILLHLLLFFKDTVSLRCPKTTENPLHEESRSVSPKVCIDPEGKRAWAMLFFKYGNETNREPEVEASSDRWIKNRKRWVGGWGENRRTERPTENGSASHLRPNELPHPQPPGPSPLTPDGWCKQAGRLFWGECEGKEQTHWKPRVNTSCWDTAKERERETMICNGAPKFWLSGAVKMWCVKINVLSISDSSLRRATQSTAQVNDWLTACLTNALRIWMAHTGAQTSFCVFVCEGVSWERKGQIWVSCSSSSGLH